MIVSSRQKEIALNSQVISLESPSQESGLFQGVFVGDRTLHCFVTTSIEATQDGFVHVCLPITPLLVQESLSGWDREIMDIYKEEISKDLTNFQAYFFSGWTASLRVSAPSIPMVSQINALDSYKIRTEQNRTV